VTHLARSRPGTPPGARGEGRPPGRARALALALPAVLLAWLFVAASPTMSQPRGAESDSSTVNQLMQTLSPKYSTSYNVERQKTKWDQVFDFRTGFGFMNFSNHTTFSVQHASDYNEDTRDGNNSTNFNWFVIPGLPVTSSLNLGRRSVTRPGSQAETNNSGVNLSTSYQRRLLGIDHIVKAGGGYARRTDLNVGSSGRSSTVDAGVKGSMSWGGTWDPSDPLTVRGNFKEDRARKRLQLESTDGSVEKTPSSSSNRSLGGNLSYDPAPWISATISASNASQRDEYFLAAYQALEKKLSGSTNLSGRFDLKPTGGLLLDLGPVEVTEVNGDLSYNTHDLTYQVRSDLASSGSTASWDGKAKGRMFGASVEANLSSDNNRLEPATSDTTVTYTHSFDGKLSRTLSPKISMRFDWLVRSTQVFYQNFNPTDRLDRDERKTKLQPALTYTPNDRWTVTASYIRTGFRQIQLSPQRASQTRDDVEYSVDMAIRYQMSTRTSIRQNYSIKARYSTLDFNPKGNTLLATQRIITSVQSQITPRVTLSMEHRFTLQDSGPFSFGPGGERLFARSVRKYIQELNPRVEYQVTPWGSIYAKSRLYRIDTDNEASSSRSTSRTLELTEGFSVKREVGSGVNLQADGSYIRSNVRDSYWSISSKLSKDF
jgi:hypothetical protein